MSIVKHYIDPAFIIGVMVALTGCQSGDQAPEHQPAQIPPATHAAAVRMAKVFTKPANPADCAGLTVTASGHDLEYDRADGLTERANRLRFLVIPGQVILFRVTEPGIWIWEGATTTSADTREASWFNPGTVTGLDVQTVVAVRSSNG